MLDDLKNHNEDESAPKPVVEEQIEPKQKTQTPAMHPERHNTASVIYAPVLANRPLHISIHNLNHKFTKQLKIHGLAEDQIHQFSRRVMHYLVNMYRSDTYYPTDKIGLSRTAKHEIEFVFVRGNKQAVLRLHK